MPRLLTAVIAAVLLHPGVSLAQTEPIRPSPAVTSGPASTVPAPPPSGATPPASAKPTAAQQAVLDRIRRLRDGEQRRFGSCSYRWDRWKLHADGTRTTTYSCETPQIVDRTVGVNCSKLQINSYEPAPQASGKGDGKPESWTWGSWRLPQAGGEEQMVATLCANALPAAPATAGSSQPAPASAKPAAPASRR